ncbi:constitutive coactivator of PPAR-gamma-like protein 1 homolog isoform X1 [Cetorhinus maximus]
MGVQGFQEFIEKHCAAAVVPVELQKLARAARHRASGLRPGLCPPPPPASPPPPPLRLLLDAETGLHRLYGGSFTDWVSGGQWNQTLAYLASLAAACRAAGLELVVAFDGALAKGRLPDWARRQSQARHSAQLVVNHVRSRGTPPPRVWFLPPPCLAHCIRLALLRFRVKVVQSIEDHHQEVISFYRENGFHGLIAYDSEYALCNVQCYLSAHALKLSWNGKSLTTNQYLMQEVAKQLNVNPAHFSIFAALLGNHILPDEDLAAFHWSLLGPDHPLASLKVRAHQLVLPPCDVVIKAVALYVSSIPDIRDLDAVAQDVFKHSRARTADKTERFKRAVEYYAAASKPRPPPPLGPSPFLGLGPGQFGMPPFPASHMQGIPQPKPMFPPPPMMQKLPYQPFPPGPGPAVAFPPSQPHLMHGPHFDPGTARHDGPLQRPGKPFGEWAGSYGPPAPPRISNHVPAKESPSPLPDSSPSSSSDAEEQNGGIAANHLTEQPPQRKANWEAAGAAPAPSKSPETSGPEGVSDARAGSRQPSAPVAQDVAAAPVNPTAHIPSLLSMQTRNHMDITTPPLPLVAPEVLRVADHRHRKGLMYPYIYQVLTMGELKLPVCIEDEANNDLPPATLLYRSARQYIYGVLFSLSETQRRAERLAMRRRIPVEVPPVIIKEWSAYKGKSPQTPELVTGLTFREWTCPNLKKLWLGKAVEDKNRRMRAFLACMKSDTPGMLNPANVPTHLLLLCCVLRYMMQWPGSRILHRYELDAFLAQAVSSKLYEPDQLQELKIDKLDARGIQLAALFMSGVDTALFANDACGQPIPWEHCCPWIYFDGKLLHSKLVRATREKAPLIDLCDGQADQVAKVEKMRQSILEGLNLSRQPMLPPSMPPPAFVPPMMAPFYPMPMYGRPFGPVPPPQGRGRSFAGIQQIPHQGGKLEIAGMVVGQWAGSRPARGRGSLNLQVVCVGGHGRGQVKDSALAGRGARGTSTRTVAATSDSSQQNPVASRSSAPTESPGALGPQSPPLEEEEEVEVVEEVVEEEEEEEEEAAPALPTESRAPGASDGQAQLNGSPKSEEEPQPPALSPSALKRDSDLCNSIAHLNALKADDSCHWEQRAEAAIRRKEE